MTQPKALYLADVLEHKAITALELACAAELRRLHDELERCLVERDALLEALKQVEPILARMYGAQAAQLPPMQTVRAAIAKAEENT